MRLSPRNAPRAVVFGVSLIIVSALAFISVGFVPAAVASVLVLAGWVIVGFGMLSLRQVPRDR